jgi:hypothetical protein
MRKKAELEGKFRTCKTHHIPNGPITTSVCLACVLRYFAGGYPCDAAVIYGIGRMDVMQSVWYIVEAIKYIPELDINFPSTHAEQKYIAGGFHGVYDADFACCVGAVDGILIWIHKPSEEECGMVLRGKNIILDLIARLYVMSIENLLICLLLSQVPRRISLHLMDHH